MSISWKNRHVVVTGGTGFIGSFLVERLLAKGAKVRVPIRAENYRTLSKRRSEIEWVAGDLRSPAYCQELLSEVDCLFHTAACRRTTEFHEKHSSNVLTQNLRMTGALIDAVQEHPIPVTFLSTANVPPSLDVIALAKKGNVDGYILSKALCELRWFVAAREFDFPLLIIRHVGAYGPRDTFSEEGNVVPSLMTKAGKAKDQLEVWGSGEQERAFLYVEDLVDAIFHLIDADVEGIQYVTSPEVVSIRELAKVIRDLVKPGLKLTFDPSKPRGERAIPVLPIHKSLKDFSWTPLSEGLTRTYESWRMKYKS